MTHFTHCKLRLGDNMAALHLLRKLAQKYPDHQFVHACFLEYFAQRIQLGEMIEDLPNISLIPMGTQPPESLDAWKGQEGLWYNHPLKNNYVAFFLDFYALLAAQMGLESPIKNGFDMLFDYPAIKKDVCNGQEWDFLVVNSAPMSGQFRGFNQGEMDALAVDLSSRYDVITTSPVKNAVCTRAAGTTVSGIGNISLHVKYIVMVSTGPSWATFNPFNLETVQKRIILLDTERINLAPNTVHVSSVAQARAELEKAGLL